MEKSLNQLIADYEKELADSVAFVRTIAPLSIEQELLALKADYAKGQAIENGLRRADRISTEGGARVIALQNRINMLEKELNKTETL